jgi:hypothetical protein
MKIRALDFVIIVLAIAVLILFCINAFAGDNLPLRAYIKSDANEFVYSLERNVSLDISGPLGTTKIVIQDGKAFITDSPCPGKTCVHAPSISKQGEWIACLPNRVLVTIERRETSEIDATSF